MGCSPWGRKESATTERLHFHFSLSCIGEGNGNPLQCSCLENPRDSGVWWAAVHGVAQGRTQLMRLCSSNSSVVLKKERNKIRRSLSEFSLAVIQMEFWKWPWALPSSLIHVFQTTTLAIAIPSPRLSAQPSSARHPHLVCPLVPRPSSAQLRSRARFSFCCSSQVF